MCSSDLAASTPSARNRATSGADLASADNRKVFPRSGNARVATSPQPTISKRFIDGFYLASMAYQVTLHNTKHQFKVEDDETILQAALAAGLVIPYGCRDGACGSCKGKLIEGQVNYGEYSTKALSDEERAAGSVLFCQEIGRAHV